MSRHGPLNFLPCPHPIPLIPILLPAHFTQALLTTGTARLFSTPPWKHFYCCADSRWVWRCRRGRRRESSFCGRRCRHQTLQIWLPCHCQDQTVPCNSRCTSMLTQEPPQSFFFSYLAQHAHQWASLLQSAPHQMSMLLCNTSLACDFENSSIRNHRHAWLHQQVVESFS